MKKFLVGFLKVAAVLIVLVILLQLLLSLFGDQYAGKLLRENIRKSGSRYALQYHDLDLGLLGRSVSFSNVQLTTNRTQTDSLGNKASSMNSSVKHLSISGISLWDYFFGDALTINSVTLVEPRVEYQPAMSKASNKQQSSFSTLDSTLYHAISGTFKALNIDELSIENGGLILFKKNAARDSSMWAENADFTFQNIHVDSTTAQSGRYFITDDITLKVGEFGQRVSDDLYNFSLTNLLISSSTQTISADSLQLTPRYPKYEFARQKGTETDRISLAIPKVEIREIDFGQIINDQKFYAKSGTIEQPRLEIFHDKSMPSPPPEQNTLPHIAFKQIGTKIKVDSLAITEGYISYAEQKAELSRPGTVSFEQLSATLHNISNYDEDLTDDHKIILETQSQVMGSAPLDVRFTFPMGDNDGQHIVEGTLSKTPATNFNQATEPIALVRFTDGMVYELDFSMTLNEYGGQGRLTLDYDNFKIELLEVEGNQAGGKKGIKSFIANAFVVRDNNHDPPLDEAKILFKRTEQKSIFNLWWKSLLSGLKNQIARL